ncbi:MAG: class I SAM-dependent methyltransferase [Actinobacteria bacterium]|jgi:SAM-dependent methyltransferase|nr:MAG: class I SAM-dependent methyltransferase [Actinomycetota bacterium]
MSDSSYYSTRYTSDPRRRAVWRHVTVYLQRWISPTADVLELGAGYCDFSNTVAAGTRTAIDVEAGFVAFADAGVVTAIGSCTDLSSFADASFDVVFASNLFEHLDRGALLTTLGEIRRVLRAGGRLIVVGPNFRLRPHEYFDDYTHVTVFTDRSLPDMLEANGFTREHVDARFLPLTLKSRLSFGHRLVPLYLRLPWRPLAGQMLVIGVRR